MTEQARTYLVGLPVAVTVYDDRVHLAVDAAEVSVAIARADTSDEHTDDEHEADATAVAHAFVALVERHECWRITASTMQHETADRRKRSPFWRR